jgi:hypothetical protein
MPPAMQPSSLLLAAACVLGCGSEARDPAETNEWLRAGLSSRAADYSEALDIGHWDFDMDGTVTVTGLSSAGGCGNETTTTTYLWHDDGPNAIEVTDLDGGPMDGGGGTSWDRVVLQLGENGYRSDGTQPVDLVRFKDGKEASRDEGAYVRGKVCLEPEESCPPGEFCNGLGCRTVWCDGEPPEPYECDG